jgi:hypothetical protein
MTYVAADESTGQGIDVAIECAYLSQWSNPFANDSGIATPAGSPAIPSSALVPRFHEPIRTDVSWPPHPRGSGRSWPPEARIDDTSLCGRLPMAYAWELLKCGKPWVWDNAPDAMSVNGADAICAVVRDICGRPGADQHVPQAVLVIPNTLSETHQQHLIDAGSIEGLRFRLLWRPVAAAISWCNANSQQLEQLPFSVDSTMGRLLALHVGFDVFEATILDVIPREIDGRIWFLPARHRPDRHGDAIESFGYDLLISVTKEFLRSENCEPTASAIWERMWCTSWLRYVLGSLVGANTDASSQFERQARSTTVADAVRGIWRSQMEGILRTSALENSIDGDLGGYLCGTFDTSRFIKWRDELSIEVGRERLLGAIVTGSLAAAPGNQHETVGHMFLRKLGCSPESAMVEGVGLPFGILAEGAACYSSRLHADLPTYLDTLPKIETVVRKQGEPVWINLLNNEDSFVDGGRKWERKNVGNLEIQEHQSELTLAVNHEEFTFVREVTTPLPHELEEKQPVSLTVSIEPAQGNATIEVVPDDMELFGRHRIIVDWKRMAVFQDENGNRKEPEEYLECLPRIYPPLSKREHSLAKWRAAQYTMRDVTERMISHPTAHSTHVKVERLLKMVQSKDPDYYREHKDATAVSSDGTVSVQQEILEDFAQAMCAALPNLPSSRTEVCIRTLGYTSTDNPAFHKFIMTEVKRVLSNQYSSNLGQHILTSCGWCLRDPEDIGVFAAACERYLRSHDTNLNVWLKAISEILRYRGHATRAIDNALAHFLIEKALATFVAQRESNNGKYLFRNSCLIIVYLLRRRAYDDGFFPPEDPLAERVKNEFRVAIEAYQNHTLTLIGGSVDLAAALQTMIDYIDRRGRGSILLGMD